MTKLYAQLSYNYNIFCIVALQTDKNKGGTLYQDFDVFRSDLNCCLFGFKYFLVIINCAVTSFVRK